MKNCSNREEILDHLPEVVRRLKRIATLSEAAYKYHKESRALDDVLVKMLEEAEDRELSYAAQRVRELRRILRETFETDDSSLS